MEKSSIVKDENLCEIEVTYKRKTCQSSLFLANALPEPDFRYFSNRKALYLHSKAI